MNPVFTKTKELAEALMNSDEYQAMKSAEDRAAHNSDAAALMSTYLEHKNKMEENLESGNPSPDIIAAHRNAMEDIQTKFRSVPDIEAMTEARRKFDELISQVNQVLQFIITGKMDAESGGCTGSCDSCPGCRQ